MHRSALIYMSYDKIRVLRLPLMPSITKSTVTERWCQRIHRGWCKGYPSYVLDGIPERFPQLLGNIFICISNAGWYHMLLIICISHAPTPKIHHKLPSQLCNNECNITPYVMRPLTASRAPSTAVSSSSTLFFSPLFSPFRRFTVSQATLASCPWQLRQLLVGTLSSLGGSPEAPLKSF